MTGYTSVFRRNIGVRGAPFLLAALWLMVALYCRIRLLAVPLERDEGGFAYVGQQLLNGIPPFESGYSMKLMGIDGAYALFIALFGQHPTAIHCGLLLVNMASIVLLYLLARHCLPMEGAFLAAGAYGLLSVSPDVLGVFAHATHFVTLFVLAGLVAFFAWREKGHFFLLLTSGVWLGTAITMKQNGLFFSVLVFGMLVMELRRRKIPLRAACVNLLIWSLGVIFPYLIILLYLTAKGVFTPFWFWTIKYSLIYAGGNSVAESIHSLLNSLLYVTKTTLPLWCIGFAGLFASFGKGVLIRHKWFPLIFLLVSFLSIMPGGNFYLHYFVLLLPALSLLIGAAYILFTEIGIRLTNIRMGSWLAIGVFVAASVMVIKKATPYLFLKEPVEVSRLVYADNPFAEASLGIANYIRANSAPADKIIVLGSEPQIYFYSGRQSATKHLFVYPLAEDQPFASLMREELFTEIVSANPKFIVISTQYSSWAAVPHEIFEMLAPVRSYIGENYKTVGIVDILAGEVFYCWGEAAESRAPLTDMPIFILARATDRD